MIASPRLHTRRLGVAALNRCVAKKRRGVDTGIVAQAPIEGSDETLTLVEQQIRNYLREAQNPSLMAELEIQQVSQVRILFESDRATNGRCAFCPLSVPRRQNLDLHLFYVTVRRQATVGKHFQLEACRL